MAAVATLPAHAAHHLTSSASASASPPPATPTRNIPVLLRTMAPFAKTLSLSMPPSATASDVLAAFFERAVHVPSPSSCATDTLRLYTRGGRLLERGVRLADMAAKSGSSGSVSALPYLELELRAAMLGGKGGFGSMLRAQGGKMSRKKGEEENTDSCRDLNGRRLSTVKEAKALAAYLAEAPAREAALSAAQAAKYAKLEKMLGRKPRSHVDFEEAAARLDEAGGALAEGDGDEDEDEAQGDASTSASTSASTPTATTVPVRGREAGSSGVHGGAGQKRERFDDHRFLEESREAVDKAKGAVAIAMAKKKKREADKAKAKARAKGDKQPTAVQAA